MKIDNDNQDTILSIRDAYKAYYKREFVVRGLDMNVKKAEIYCLLGASGCGKSTLLNIIFGLIDLDSGIINTNVTSRDDIGYMTQEISLYGQFNIYETFNYYGTIYGMSKTEIKREMSLYYKLLDLPDQKSCVQVLSGGEKRRLSLAVALLNNPTLVILDEPTVGVDTLLRESIWEYLVKLCEVDKKTIIITTHYIEEGKQAHTVGFMRNGRLLCEHSPGDLLEMYNANTLEDVFLELCQQKISDMSNHNQKISFKKNKYALRLSTPNAVNRHKIFGEIIKNLIYLKRNISVTAFTMLVPAFCLMIFSYSCGRDPDRLKFGIVNDEINFGTGDCETVNRSGNCNMEYLSCIYEEKLWARNLVLHEYADVSTAVEDVVRNKVWGVMHFPQNYSRSIKILIDDPVTNDESVFSNFAFLYMDYTNVIIKNFLLREINEGYTDVVKDIYHDCNWKIDAALSPLKFQTPIYGDLVPDFTIYFSSPMITMLLFTTPLMYGLTIMVEEKSTGATARSIIAGVNLYEVLISHFLVQSCLQIFQTLLFLASYALLQFPLKQLVLAAVFLYMQSLMGIALAFALAASTDSVYIASGFQTGLTMVTVWIGGMLWPVEAAPFGVRIISWMLPSTLPIETVRTITIRGKGIGDFVVYRGFITTTIWIALLTSFTYIYIKATRGRSYYLKT